MEWISVKEVLPENNPNKDLIIWLGNSELPSWRNSIYVENEFYLEGYNNSQKKVHYIKEKVTHWAEITPPKTKDNE